MAALKGSELGISSESMKEDVRRMAELAKSASERLATTTASVRNSALDAMACALIERTCDILLANGEDMDAARAAGVGESLLDRLMLDEGRISAMADALRDLAGQSDPLGKVQMSRTLPNGMSLERVSVPLGVVAMVFEARPNVCADAAGICVKSGNACILRGGSMAARSNEAIASVLAAAAMEAGLPEGSICAIGCTDRAATDALMQLHGLVDVLIPRGGAGLIRHCVEHSKVPVIETGTGNCHVYVERSADMRMARDIVINSKCRRYGVCNAAESLLVDEAASGEALAAILPDLAREGVLMHMDAPSMEIARSLGIDGSLLVAADQSDWETEYLAPEIAVRTVSGTSEAIAHINRYGTKHSEAIVTNDDSAAAMFCGAVDASAVYVNAPTSFTDGGEFGLGAEIGISTQKLHARGPFAIDALTSYKYILHGSGQVRG